MPWSGGTFSRVHDWTEDAAGDFPNIEASRMDTEDDNFQSGINDCIHKGGQNSATANLPMGGNRHTGVANAAARDNYASAADLQDQDLIYGVTTGSSNIYALTLAPAITAYEEGLKVVFKANHTNDDVATLNVNSVGAVSIRDHNSAVLQATTIVAGRIYEVTYNSSGWWQLTSPIAKLPIAAGGTNSTTASEARTALGLEIGTNVQAYDANLTELAGIDSPVAADAFIVSTGANTWQKASAASARTSMGVEIGTDVQAFDAHLQDIADIAAPTGADEVLVSTGAGAYALESGDTLRTSLGLGTGNSPQFTGVNVGHASDTTLTRQAAGQLAIAGDAVFSHQDGTGTYPSAKIHVSTSAPTGGDGSVGDIWLEREA